jgi:hypothetical protein
LIDVHFAVRPGDFAFTEDKPMSFADVHIDDSLTLIHLCPI